MEKIDGIDFSELEAERYWSFSSSYKKDKKAEVRNMVFSGEYLGARKMDGAYYRFIKDMNGEMELNGRSRGVDGHFLNKIGHVPHLMSFFSSLPPGTVLLGELYFPKHEGSNEVTKIMGCKEDKAIERQKIDKLHYYVFDVWAYNGASLLGTAANERFRLVQDLTPTKYIDLATYYRGEELWDKYQEILAVGGEGVVITKESSRPEPGKRTARKTLKLKKELEDTIDCIVIGANPPTKEYTGKNIEDWPYYVNEVTEEKLPVKSHYKEYFMGEPIIPVTKNWYLDMAGSLRLGLYNKDTNKIVYYGDLSGLPYEVLEDWESYRGSICEVNAMQLTDDKKLRHPRFVQWRTDKRIDECSFDQIE